MRPEFTEENGTLSSTGGSRERRQRGHGKIDIFTSRNGEYDIALGRYTCACDVSNALADSL